MSILIKGTDKPKSCDKCFAWDEEYCICKITNDDRPLCPMLKMPKHGLIMDMNVFNRLGADQHVLVMEENVV